MMALIFSPDGKQLASGSMDNTLCLWAIQSDREQFASSSHDGTIRLWNVTTGARLRVLEDLGPYAGMNIQGITDITPVQRASRKELNAVEA